MLGIRGFDSGRFGLFDFPVIRVGMFRNHLGTSHFSDRFDSDNDGFGRVSILLQNPKHNRILNGSGLKPKKQKKKKLENPSKTRKNWKLG